MQLRVAGVSIIPRENFTSFDDAIAFVKTNPTRYVIKPSGEARWGDRAEVWVEGIPHSNSHAHYNKIRRSAMTEDQRHPADRI